MQNSDDILSLYDRALDRTRQLAANIRPDQYAKPTPCSEWDVRALLNHLADLQRMTVAAVGGADTQQTELVRGDADPVAAFEAAATQARGALHAPGFLEREFPAPWGSVQGSRLAGILFLDLLLHGWDLAKATDQPTELDPELCSIALAMGKAMMKPEFRQAGGAFGPEVPIANDAPVCDRLAAFYGRRP
ncbi:MAG: TIGR03086 family protein [Thermomicrobiales bacterium]|nr:TIGR03086 family protein [Thermomicrobiales bacterium]